jgi:hypothetical protein
MNKLNVDEVTPERFASNLSEEFLAKQPDEWFTRFYAFLREQRALWRSGPWNQGILRNEPIVRLQDGNNVNPFKNTASSKNDEVPNAYLVAGTDIETSFPIVRLSISQNEEARKFLEDLGIPELDIVAKIIEHVLSKYKMGEEIPEETHKQDISKIERAYKIGSKNIERLKKELLATPFVSARFWDGENRYRKPDEIYFQTDELTMYFSENPMCGFVSHGYSGTVKSLLCNLGVTSTVRVTRKPRNATGHVTVKDYRGWHERGIDGFDPDMKIDGLEFAIQNSSAEKSTFIWNEVGIRHAV